MVTAVACQASASGDPGLVIKQAATEDPPEQSSREATPNGEEAQGKEGESKVATVVRSEGVAAAAARVWFGALAWVAKAIPPQCRGERAIGQGTRGRAYESNRSHPQ